MKQVVLHKPLTEDEYFVFEERSELKHEFINGILYEMSGSSKYHNRLERHFANFIEHLLEGKGFEVYSEGFKVRTPDSNFFYPDVIVCSQNTERYFTHEPVLLVEVLSETTRKFDLTDKFIQYQKIPTLQYYLCMEPEQQVIIFYFRNETGEWQTETYSKSESRIDLPKLGVSFSVEEVYSM